MILGTGIDIIEIERIKKAVMKENFVKRVFTELEQIYCHSRGAQAAASYAARFAAKEAVMKALGTGLAGGNWLDIEVCNDEAGKPQLALSGSFGRLAAQQGVTAIHLSLTHAREYAAAQVILCGRKN